MYVEAKAFCASCNRITNQWSSNAKGMIFVNGISFLSYEMVFSLASIGNILIKMLVIL